MIALAVLFGLVMVGVLVVGFFLVKVRRETALLSEKVTWAAGGYQASSADLRERVRREGSRR